MQNNIRWAASERGFTLLEIMISLVLISLAVVSLIELSSANLRNLAVSDTQVEMLARANEKLREVLDMESFEEKSWTDRDDDGYVHDIAIAEIEKERSEALTVRLLQITLTTGKSDEKNGKKVTLKTARLAPKADALSGADKTRESFSP